MNGHTSFIPIDVRNVLSEWRYVKCCLLTVLFLSFELLLQAGTFKDDQSTIMQKARKLYRERQYQAAYDLLKARYTSQQNVLDSTASYANFLMGKCADRLGKGEEGVRWHKKALGWRKTHFEETHVQLLASYEGLGDVYRYVLGLGNVRVCFIRP